MKWGIFAGNVVYGIFVSFFMRPTSGISAAATITENRD
jgi:hypothetical protein